MRFPALMSTCALAAMLSSRAYAFHSGGVAKCGGCHSMHSPADTQVGFRVVGSDRSSTCLTCHGQPGQSSYQIATPDAHLATPGGTYPQNQLACHSCHDPHGKYRRSTGDVIAPTGQAIYASGSYKTPGNEPIAAHAVGAYRLLAGSGYAPVGMPVAPYPGVPAAKVKSGYNSSEATTETRVAYGALSAKGNTTWGTWGRWCGTCHPAMHSSGCTRAASTSTSSPTQFPDPE